MDEAMQRFAVKSLYRPKVAQAATDALSEVFPGWKFKVHSVETHTTAGK